MSKRNHWYVMVALICALAFMQTAMAAEIAYGFDYAAEGWREGNTASRTAMEVTGGALRFQVKPVNGTAAFDPIINGPTLNWSAATYNRIKMKIKKTGGPATLNGQFFIFIATNGGRWMNYNYTLNEGDNTISVDLTSPSAKADSADTYSGTVTNCRIDIPDGSSAADAGPAVFDIDWIAITDSDSYTGPTAPTGLPLPAGLGVTKLPSQTLNPEATDLANVKNQFEPNIATDGNGNYIVVYTRANSDDTRDMMACKSTDKGATWGAPVKVNSYAATTGGDGSPFISYAGGTWIATWVSRSNVGGVHDDAAAADKVNRDICVSRSTDGGATWSAVVLMNTATDPAGDTAQAEEIPRVAGDGAGKWILTWRSSENVTLTAGAKGTDYDTLYSVSTDNGLSWSNAKALQGWATVDNSNDNTAAIMYGNGRFIVIVQSNYATDTTTADNDLRYYYSDDAGATWTGPAFLNSDAATDASNKVDTNVRFATDGAGKWMAVWNSEPLPFGIDRDLYFATSADNGATWSAMALVNTWANGDNAFDGDPNIAYSDGVWGVAWGSEYQYCDRDIIVTRTADFGATWAPQLPGNDYAKSDDASDTGAVIAGGANGDFVLAWQQSGGFTKTGIKYANNVWACGFFPRMVLADGDEDNDGVLNKDESLADTDGDGLIDLLDDDSDNDGLKDGYEVTIGTNPLIDDTDGDGLKDGVEVTNGTNPKKADSDNDGLNDKQEGDYGTDPLQWDTDGDGASDGSEIANGTDPLDPGSTPSLPVLGLAALGLMVLMLAFGGFWAVRRRMSN